MLAIIKDLRLRWQQIKRRRMLKRWRHLFEFYGHPHAHMSDDELEAHLLTMLELFNSAMMKVGLTAKEFANVLSRVGRIAAKEEIDG